MLTPNHLYPGARVALVAPSSAVPEDKLAPGVESVRALGLEPVVYPSCYDADRHGYFAADDAQRARDIQDAFADDAIAGVLCVRGGYGAHRLLPLLDLEAIARRPKPFFGYSDVTALHTAFNQVCGFVTYHTPMPTTEPYDALDGLTASSLRKALFGGSGDFIPPYDPQTAPDKRSTLYPGCAAGTLCGGNLSLLAAGLGTPWELDARGKILFLEDIGEKHYRVDAMLTQLRNAGKFDDCAGVVLGAWTDCVPEDPARDMALTEIFEELIVPAHKPAIMGFQCGHTLPTYSLPLGGRAVIDADKLIMEVTA